MAVLVVIALVVVVAVAITLPLPDFVAHSTRVYNFHIVLHILIPILM